MPGLTDAATRKVGPLPAWGWGAVIVGGYIGYRFLKGGGNDTTAAGVPVDMAGTTSDNGGGGGGGGIDTSGLQVAIDKLRDAVTAIPAPGATGGGGGGGGSQTGSGAGGSTGSGGVIAGGGFPDVITPIQNAVQNVVPQSPTQLWGTPISLAAPSGDTYTLAQQYFYAINHPGLPGYGGSAPDRSTLFTQDTSIMRNQLQQLLLSIGSSAATTLYPDYTGSGSASGGAYPEVPTSVYQFAGVAKEQFVPTSFLGAQYAAQGYTLNIDPNIPGANQHPSVQIAAIQAMIAQKTDMNGNQLSAAQITSLRSQLAALQKAYAAQTAQFEGQVNPATSGALPSIDYGNYGATATPAPSTSSTPVDYSKAISTVQGYIANLSAVRNPTTAQKTELAMYQARLADYSSR